MTWANPARRAAWLKTVYQWHWISSAACLVGMLLFALTGITLNHAAQIEARPQTITLERQMPEAMLALLQNADERAPGHLPAPVHAWLEDALEVRLRIQAVDWSPSEVYLSLPRPGGDAWLSIDREQGAVLYERTDRGWIAWLNDLHKGRNTGVAWSWFLDVFAVLCLVFCITGLWMLHLHAARRPLTWPLVGFGLAAPWILILLTLHD